MIPVGNSNRPRITLNASGGLWITVHETGNEDVDAGAKMHADFVYNGGGKHNVSFHFTVDHLGAYQMLPCNEIGYHASDGCDNRATDFGCFASVAIETCVDSNNVNKAQTRENLIALISMIITGHPAIYYGGINPDRFSVSRIATHNKWAYDAKWCPKHMLNDGYVAKIPGKVQANIAGHNPDPIPGGEFVIGDRLVTTDNLNARGGYGLRYPVVDTVPAGTAVTVIADDVGAFTVSADGHRWYNIAFPGRTGWAAANWLDRAEEPQPIPEPERDTFTLRYPLPFREEPGFNGGIIRELPVGTSGTVISGPQEKDGMNWYQVEVAGASGYIPQGILWAVSID